MNKSKPDKKPVRLELRIMDANPALHRAVVDGAKKNFRTMAQEMSFQLSKAYGLNEKS